MPKPKPPPLTPAFLRHVKPPRIGQIEIADGGCPGLRLRLSTSVATWVLGCRDAVGRARRFVLGSFPEMGLKEARDAARELRVKVRRGHDPIAEARARRHAAADQTTVTTLATLLDAYAKAGGVSRRSWPKNRRNMNNVFGKYLNRPAQGLTAAELQLAADAWPSAASAGVAVRTLRPVLRWAAKRELVADGVAGRLEQPAGAECQRDRVLTRDEIHAVLNALDGALSCYGDALRWLFWTCCRLDEVCSMRWRDVDLATGLLTVLSVKTSNTYVVPLPRQALELLQTRQAGGAGGVNADDRVYSRTRGRRH
jgi:integrase